MSLATAAPERTAEVLSVIARLCREQLRLPRVTVDPEQLLATLELDSIELLSLVVGLEDHFRIALAEEDAGELRTVGELAALVSRRVAERAS